MHPHLLDSFAAAVIGTTLDELTRTQRMPAAKPVCRRGRPRRAAVALTTTVGIAAPALTAVVVVVAQ